MQVSQILQALGEDGFRQALGTVTISKLKTYQLYESLKTRGRIAKLNVAGFKKALPRFWERVADNDEDLAGDLAQAILVSNLDMIIEVLDFLKVPHQDGFFEKDLAADDILTGDWRARAFKQLRKKFPEPVLVFYLNHLAHEVTKAEDLFTPAGAE